MKCFGLKCKKEPCNDEVVQTIQILAVTSVVCSVFTPSKIQRNITPKLKTAYRYKHYFDCELGDQDKPWAPHIVCNSCYSSLTSWLDRSRVCSFKLAFCCAYDMA